MINSLTVLGGGTAGLISALLIKKSHPTIDVTVVESASVGIIGVGEGSTEHWLTLMQFLNIPIEELLIETGATFKTGIRFSNWHGDGTDYWHSLLPEFVCLDRQSGVNLGLIFAIANNLDPTKTVPDEIRNSYHAENFSVNQFHFDTHKLNTYFHQLGEKLGIQFIEDTINNVVLDDQGFVKKIVGKKSEYESDFFIDSSGFAKVINSKLDCNWIDCQKYLPMNSAIAFPTPYKEEIPSHTEARALSSGWMWRIPTQQRFGNGYVYCDDFINDEDAFAEVSAQFDHEIEIGKKIKFSAGYVDKFWSKNCCSVGLAGMFVEPLEATSIGFTIQQIFCLIASLPYWNKNNNLQQTVYNKKMQEVAENIINFVQIHYFTERRDSEFWRWTENNLTWTDWNKEYITQYKSVLPGTIEFNEHFLMFKGSNFQQVMHGLRLFNHQEIKKVWDKHYAHHEKYFKQLYATKIQNPIPHRQVLENLMQLKPSTVAETLENVFRKN